jgi:maltooligosyltrehalose trehalohydrolase
MARETFEVSRLTRQEDPAVATLYRELLSLRRRLPSGDPDRVDYDEDARWLEIDRGPYRIVASFSPDELTRPARGYALALRSSPGVTLSRGRLTLAPRSGAVLTSKES